MKLLFKTKTGGILKEIEITKAVRMNGGGCRFYVEPAQNGHRLLWSAELLEEFSDVSEITVQREPLESSA